MDVVTAADRRRVAASAILEKLQLVDRWSAVGRPVLVGATAYDLMVAPDIDMEIFCAGEPPIEAGFAVLAGCAAHPDTTKARFSNRLVEQDEGLYWQLRHRHDGEEWKIDMWTLRDGHPGPLATTMVEPMKAAMTPERRRRILTVKQALAEGPEDERCGSIHVYRAVLESGVTTLDEFRAWRVGHDTTSLTTWTPS